MNTSAAEEGERTGRGRFWSSEMDAIGNVNHNKSVVRLYVCSTH